MATQNITSRNQLPSKTTKIRCIKSNNGLWLIIISYPKHHPQFKQQSVMSCQPTLSVNMHAPTMVTHRKGRSRGHQTCWRESCGTHTHTTRAAQDCKKQQQQRHTANQFLSTQRHHSCVSGHTKPHHPEQFVTLNYNHHCKKRKQKNSQKK